MNKPVNLLYRLLPLLILVVAIFVWPNDALAAEPPNRYEIAVDLDYDRGALDAVQMVTFRNNTTRQLGSAVFNVTSANYRAFTLKEAFVDGVSVSPSLTGVVLEVPLPSPLAPGAGVEIRLKFGYTVPSPGNLRFGRSMGVIALGNWYPVLSVIDPRTGDWDRHQYVDVGDAFVTEVADYDVVLALNRQVTFGHTGAATQVGSNVWRITAKGVRDFAMALSDRYAIKQTTVGNTSVTAMYLPQHAMGAAIYLPATVEAMEWMNRAVAPYPYPNLFVVETMSDDPAWVGQEYPGIVFISSGSTLAGGNITSYLGYLVIHEVYHQWFYSVVGNDQLYEPWLDEALTTYMSYEFYRANYPSLYPSMWQRFVDGYRQAVAGGGDRAVNTGIYDYQSEGLYFIIIYRKGSVFLDDLRRQMGDGSFYALMRDYYARYQDALARGTDFLDMAVARSTADLSPLFNRYFTYGKYGNALDWDVPRGRFYTQANGEPPGKSKKGYAVMDDSAAAFWTEFKRLGGVEGVGYPISRRFNWNGFVSQAMQKGVLQWRPEVGRAFFVNVFDEMNGKGLDEWLTAYRQTPPPADWSADRGKGWEDVVRAHQALLQANPAIGSAYFAAGDPVSLYGLPMAYADMGNNFTLRAQRVVIQQWKEDVPWAKAGQVTVANGGDIAQEAGLIPQEALVAVEDR